MAFVLMVVLVAVFFFYLPDKWSNNVENMHAVLCFFFHYLYAYAQCETSIKYHGSLCNDLGLLFVLSTLAIIGKCPGCDIPENTQVILKCHSDTVFKYETIRERH